ncbi:MAG: dephospho-CoA kinase [bacterium]|nr:dephospho-CoA kinase [bacterium]
MAVSGNPLRVVVFGGIGSGKSTFTSFLAQEGAIVIEADTIGHDVLRPDGAGFDAVRSRWPQALTGGEIDRRALAAIVFTDPVQLAELEAITHPLISAEIRRRARAAGSTPVVVELPLTKALLNDDSWTWVLVEAPRQARMQRAVDRGASATDVAARMAAQPADEQWHARADWIVPNVGSLAELGEAAAELWRNLRRA